MHNAKIATRNPRTLAIACAVKYRNRYGYNSITRINACSCAMVAINTILAKYPKAPILLLQIAGYAAIYNTVLTRGTYSNARCMRKA